MVVIMNAEASQEDIEGVIHAIEEKGLEAKVMEGARQKIVGVIGDKTLLAATPPWPRASQPNASFSTRGSGSPRHLSRTGSCCAAWILSRPWDTGC